VVQFLAAWLAGGVAVLMTTRNIGYGFTLPLLAPALVLVTCALTARQAHPPARWPAAAAVVLTAVAVLSRQAVPQLPLSGSDRLWQEMGLQTGLAHFYGDAGFGGGDEAAWKEVNEQAVRWATSAPWLYLDAAHALFTTSSVYYLALRQSERARVRVVPPDDCTTLTRCRSFLLHAPAGSVFVQAVGRGLAPHPDSLVLSSALSACTVVGRAGVDRATFYRCSPSA
jgi:hypothetical protein